MLIGPNEKSTKDVDQSIYHFCCANCSSCERKEMKKKCRKKEKRKFAQKWKLLKWIDWNNLHVKCLNDFACELYCNCNNNNKIFFSSIKSKKKCLDGMFRIICTCAHYTPIHTDNHYCRIHRIRNSWMENRRKTKIVIHGRT